MKKFAFLIAAAAAVLFVAGCSTENTTVQPDHTTHATKAVHHTTYHSKLGTMSTKKDIKK